MWMTPKWNENEMHCRERMAPAAIGQPEMQFCNVWRKNCPDGCLGQFLAISSLDDIQRTLFGTINFDNQINFVTTRGRNGRRGKKKGREGLSRFVGVAEFGADAISAAASSPSLLLRFQADYGREGGRKAVFVSGIAQPPNQIICSLSIQQQVPPRLPHLP